LTHSSTRLALAAGVAALTLAAAGGAAARDQIRVVGSSTVFPYSQAAAEEFANKSGKPAPVVESTGTGGGMKIFCQGIGVGHPDVTGASRAIKKSEVELCAKNGVTDITEAQIGFDGLSIAIARGGADLDMPVPVIYLALAAEVPMGGKIVANPFKTWADVAGAAKAYGIDVKLPNTAIQAFGPPPTSGTRDAFVELVMEVGCGKFAEVAALKADKKRHAEVCTRMRQDGPFIEAGENDNLIVQRLKADASAVGIFGYSFLYENEDSLKAVKVGGVAPSFDTIGDGSYPVSRPIFFYVKNAHRNVIPGLNDFLKEYVSDAAMGANGYLHERGLVPLSDAKRKAVQDAVLNAKSLASM
jgi:phosphate transport system substrate-binding protein